MQPDYEQLIVKLLDGSISTEQRKALENWMNESPENRALVDQARLIWQHSSEKSSPRDFRTAEEWDKLEASIKTEETSARHRILVHLPVLKIAAAIAVVTVCAFLLYRSAFRNGSVVLESNSIAAMFVLPDSSTVWMNKASRISYDKNFNDTDRTITLSGEAFFNITRDEQRPFTIQTDEALVKVLGTSFNVNAYPEGGRTDVFVSTGLVQFSHAGSVSEALTLRPGEAAVLWQGKSAVERAVPDLNALAWKDRKLVFRKTALHNVVETLENYFQISIHIENRNILGCRFTSSFNDPSLEEIIEALTVTMNLEIAKESDAHYKIKGAGCL